MKNVFLLFLFAALACSHTAMSRRGQYDEEARREERLEREQKKAQKKKVHPAKRLATGVKQVTVDAPAGLISETAESTTTETPIVGTLEGARQATGKILDSTVRGASKVATLGYGEVDSYEIVEPEAGSEETTKIKIKIPGT